jgi:hypothetical protein
MSLDFYSSSNKQKRLNPRQDFHPCCVVTRLHVPQCRWRAHGEHRHPSHLVVRRSHALSLLTWCHRRPHREQQRRCEWKPSRNEEPLSWGVNRGQVKNLNGILPAHNSNGAVTPSHEKVESEEAS